MANTRVKEEKEKNKRNNESKRKRYVGCGRHKAFTTTTIASPTFPENPFFPAKHGKSHKSRAESRQHPILASAEQFEGSFVFWERMAAPWTKVQIIPEAPPT
ncbi:hypothetical protein K0M31_020296 [Melipona bicolor]|uniref:Uncharacterized protein n=1 Tax=Melipona bicolor TaxID=60889 RepID=A0AA40G1H3_9HYME|nr:hypothetical protein K0M31_020296 [Melipona bicolor]